MRIETNVYAVKDGKLIWGAVSETVHPASIEKAIAEVAQAAAKDLRERGLIPSAER